MCTAAAYASWLSCFCKALINRPSKMKPQLLAPGVFFCVCVFGQQLVPSASAKYITVISDDELSLHEKHIHTL